MSSRRATQGKTAFFLLAMVQKLNFSAFLQNLHFVNLFFIKDNLKNLIQGVRSHKADFKNRPAEKRV